MAYALGPWLSRESHSAIGLLVWALPFTLIATELTRRRSAAGVFAHLPDLGPLMLRSFRVLSTRRPSRIVTVSSAVVGAASHSVIDAFSHQGRWGANLFRLNSVLFSAPGGRDITGAKLVQYAGHSFGSLAFILVLMLIARGGRLEEWYGIDAVDEVRTRMPSTPERVAFWSIVVAPTAFAAWLVFINGVSNLFLVIAVLVAAVLTAGAVVPSATSGVKPRLF